MEEKIKFPKDDFIFGVNYLFQKWEALQLTIENETAGEETLDLIEDFKNKIISWLLEDDQVTGQELEKYMEDVLIEDIGVEFEDGSITEISAWIVKLYSALSKTGESVLIKQARKEEKEKQEKEKERLEKLEKKMDIIEEIIEDEDDGWETVKSKNKKK